ncbi:MAG: glycosyltransferase family 2 protein [Phycisphaerales bacterium JB037]
MTRSHLQPRRPVAVEAPPTTPAGDGHPPKAPATTASVAVLIVTWNRWEMADRVLAAIARQSHDPSRLEVVIIDNASSDGTTDELVARWSPERLVDNPTQAALEPRFAPRVTGRRNAAGFGSMTIIRNGSNLGGCGGFNTGLAWTQHRAASEPGFNPDFVWLVDDDVDLPTDALAQLVSAANADPSLGLVGSRTCDIDDRARTIETTVYLNPDTGLMADEPSPAHPLHESHRQWTATVGGTKGGTGYTGLRPVDVVSACSLLARWSAVEQVGLWDGRYFIYCDDADWSLRFARAGWGVALNLDAVVYHTPWHHKLTLARLYYAQRNLLWMLRKTLPAERVRPVLRERLSGLLRESLKAALMRRLTHAELIRRSVSDAIGNRGGKLSHQAPPTVTLKEAIERFSARNPAQLAFLCNRPACQGWADQLKQGLTQAASEAHRPAPAWTRLVRNDLSPQPRGDERTIVYSLRRRSRLRRQLPLWFHRPTAAVVFDNGNDFPLLSGRWTLHADPKDLSRVMIEPNRLRDRLAFGARWGWTLLRAAWFLLMLPKLPAPQSASFDRVEKAPGDGAATA